MPHVVDDRWIGQTLAGDYLVEERLGEGGMGAVYKALHVRTGGLRAIKILLPEAAANPEIYRRFADEAKITSALRHPHIVQVTDFDQADGTPFIAMEYLDGITLERRIRQKGPLTLAEGVEFLRQVGSALQAAHDAGVVHRDIKPQNILLCRYLLAGKEALMTKVLDFGISHIRRSVSMMTRDSALLGTPHYMAPEMARGRNSELDGRADQFSLAVVLYYAFTGREPFDSDDLLAVLHQVIYEEPEPLSKLAPHLPAHTVAAITRALSKSKDDRFASMLDFVHAVETAPPVPDLLSPAPAEPFVPQASVQAISVSKFPFPEGQIGSLPDAVHPPVIATRRRRWPFALVSLLLVGGAGLLYTEFMRAPSRRLTTVTKAEQPKTRSAPEDLAQYVAAAPKLDLALPLVATLTGSPSLPLVNAPEAEQPKAFRPAPENRAIAVAPGAAPQQIATLNKGIAPAKRTERHGGTVSSSEKSTPIPPTSLAVAQTNAAGRKLVEGEKNSPSGFQPSATPSKAVSSEVPTPPSVLPLSNSKIATTETPLTPKPAASPLAESAPNSGELAKVSRPAQQGIEQVIKQAWAALKTDPKQTSMLLAPVLENGSGRVWLLYGMAACRQRNKSESYAAYKQLDVTRRRKLIDYCQDAQFPLL